MTEEEYIKKHQELLDKIRVLKDGYIAQISFKEGDIIEWDNFSLNGDCVSTTKGQIINIRVDYLGHFSYRVFLAKKDGSISGKEKTLYYHTKIRKI